MLKHSLFIVCLLTFFTGCKDDDSIKKSTDGSDVGVATISIAGNTGVTATSELTDYVESLTMLFFKENASNVFVLESYTTYTLAELTAFSGASSSTTGMSDTKEITVDNIPIGTYRVACVGNIFDSNGNALSTAQLSGVAQGANMEEVIVQILSDNQSPKLFFDLSDNLIIGSSATDLSMVLERKISMLNLTLTNVPAAVTDIEVEISNTYDAFHADGNFLSSSSITVEADFEYNVTATQDSVFIQVFCLPTISESTSTLNINFTIDNGAQTIETTSPNTYTFAPNTMLELTGSVDSSTSGGAWDIDVTFGISVDTEWDVTVEPDISL